MQHQFYGQLCNTARKALIAHLSVNLGKHPAHFRLNGVFKAYNKEIYLPAPPELEHYKESYGSHNRRYYSEHILARADNYAHGYAPK